MLWQDSPEVLMLEPLPARRRQSGIVLHAQARKGGSMSHWRVGAAHPAVRTIQCVSPRDS
eukprot:9945366-Prorocentrum_lima.AAC.1